MSLNLAIISYKLSKNKRLFLLIQKNQEKLLFPIAATILEKNNNAIFIESLDTTGLFSPRKNQTFYTQAFILFLLKESKGYIECFSHPKNELIFINSNKNKSCFSPGKLLEYWFNLFSMISENVIIWSNYLKKSTISNSNNDLKVLKIISNNEIHFFDDDPKRKQNESFDEKTSTEDLFRILLTRKDFVKGGIIIGYGIKNTNKFCRNEKLIREISDKFRIISFEEKNDFENLNLLSQIRKCDWTSHKSADLCLKKLINVENLEFQIFNNLNENLIETKETEKIITLKPRKK